MFDLSLIRQEEYYIEKLFNPYYTGGWRVLSSHQTYAIASRIMLLKWTYRTQHSDQNDKTLKYMTVDCVNPTWNYIAAKSVLLPF